MTNTPGPWAAYLADAYGFIATNVKDLFEGGGEISIRRDTAGPRHDEPDRLTGTYYSADVFMAIDISDLDEGNVEEIEERLALARAAADGMNRMLATKGQVAA